MAWERRLHVSRLLRNLKPVTTDYKDGRFEGTQEEFNK